MARQVGSQCTPAPVAYVHSARMCPRTRETTCRCGWSSRTNTHSTYWVRWWKRILEWRLLLYSRNSFESIFRGNFLRIPKGFNTTHAGVLARTPIGLEYSQYAPRQDVPTLSHCMKLHIPITEACVKWEAVKPTIECVARDHPPRTHAHVHTHEYNLA